MLRVGLLGGSPKVICEYIAPGILSTAAVFDSFDRSRLGDLVGVLCASSFAAALADAEEAKIDLADFSTEYSLFFDALKGPSWCFFAGGDPAGVVDWISPMAYAKFGFETEIAFW